MLTYNAIMVGVEINQTFEGGKDTDTDMKEEIQLYTRQGVMKSKEM